MPNAAKQRHWSGCSDAHSRLWCCTLVIGFFSPFRFNLHWGSVFERTFLPFHIHVLSVQLLDQQRRHALPEINCVDFSWSVMGRSVFFSRRISLIFSMRSQLCLLSKGIRFKNSEIKNDRKYFWIVIRPYVMKQFVLEWRPFWIV